MPNASGWTERIPPKCRKWREARRGGSSWSVSHPRSRACLARAAMKPWTAPVCSMLRRSWRLRLPETLRQSPASLGAALHRFLAPPTAARSLRASIASPWSVRGESASSGGDAGDEAEPLQGGGDLIGAMTDEAQQPGQVVEGEPGPVGEQVEGALLGGLQQGGQHVIGDSPSASVLTNVVGHGSPRQGPLGGKRAPGVHPVDGFPQADGGVDRGQPPHPVAGGSPGRVALDGEDCGGLRSGQQPSGVAQPGLVGDDQEDAAKARPLFEPPEPLGEARTVGGVSLPDDGDGAPSGEGDGGVHRHGPVPAEADGVADVGDGGGQPVDDGHGVEPLQEEATPPGRRRGGSGGGPSTGTPSSWAKRRSPAAVRWNLRVGAVRSVAWGTGAASPSSSSLRTAL